MSDLRERGRDEFLNEAQDIIEGFSRNLLALDGALRKGQAEDPSILNEAFRAVHTLKGLAGLFGATVVGRVSHRMEDVLDDLRLGRLILSARVLDTLFHGVDVLHQGLQAAQSTGREDEAFEEEFFEELAALGAPSLQAPPLAGGYALDEGILGVLTEYEEHRLNTNLRDGKRLFRLRVVFDLMTIDKELEAIKGKAKGLGEIITYLPAGESTSPDTIDLDLLLASTEDLHTLVGVLGADNVVVEEVGRLLSHPPSAASPTPAVPLPTIPPSGHPSTVPPPVRPPPVVRAAGTELPQPRPTGVPVPLPDAPLPERRREVEPHPVRSKPDESLESASHRAQAQTVRVDIRKLDHLMNIVGELAIVRGSLARLADEVRRSGDRRTGAELQRVQRSFERRLSEIQDGILEVRMVPLGQVFDRLARVVRQLGRDAQKEIRLVITGAETEIDKLIVEELSDPLMHMMRNAVDHGIESAMRREAVGKPLAGTIALNAYQKGNHVMIEIEDDGGGIDVERVVERAIELGVLDEQGARDLSLQEKVALIFAPGLTTRREVGEFSGRGVGMDVVKTNIAKLGGVVDIHTELGIGTKVTITLPITLAIVSSLILEVAGQRFAIPLSSVTEAIALDEREVRVVDGREVTTLRGTTLRLCRLCRLLHLPEAPHRAQQRFVIVASMGTRRVGLVVDRLWGQQDIVIKPLGRTLKRARGLSGATELGDQRVGLVLDAAALIEEVLAGTTEFKTRALERWHN